MNRALILLAPIAFLVTACGQSDETRNENVTGLGSGPASTAVEDTAAQAVGAVTAPLANSVESFVTNAAVSDLYEIEAGRMALQKASSPEIKSFAQMMVTDHRATSDKLKSTLAKANLTVAPPTALDARRQGMIDNLRAAAAGAFDKVYLDQQTAAHQEALTLMTSYAEDGENAPLKALAAATAPKIQEHFDHVRRLDRGGMDGTQ